MNFGFPNWVSKSILKSKINVTLHSKFLFVLIYTNLDGPYLAKNIALTIFVGHQWPWIPKIRASLHNWHCYCQFHLFNYILRPIYTLFFTIWLFRYWLVLIRYILFSKFNLNNSTVEIRSETLNILFFF